MGRQSFTPKQMIAKPLEADVLAGRVFSSGFVADQTHTGRKYRMLNIICGPKRECLAIVPLRRLQSKNVIDVLIEHGPPAHIRSDTGPELVDESVREWLPRLGVTTRYIEPVSPWKNGSIDCFNGRVRDELLDGEIFPSLDEVRIATRGGRERYNRAHPHSRLGYRAPLRRRRLRQRSHSAALCSATRPGWRHTRRAANHANGPIIAGGSDRQEINRQKSKKTRPGGRYGLHGI
jgi:IS30 family transposase